MPEKNVGEGFALLLELLLDLLLDAFEVHDIDQNESVDVAMRNQLGGSRAEGTVCASDHDSPSFVRLGVDLWFAVVLLAEKLIREVFADDPGDAERGDGDDGSHAAEQPIADHLHCMQMLLPTRSGRVFGDVYVCVGKVDRLVGEELIREILKWSD